MELLLALGRPEEADALGSAIAGTLALPARGVVNALRAEAWGKLGRVEAGIRLAEETLHDAHQAGARGVAVRAASARAALALTGEDWEAAQHAAEEGLVLAEALGCRLEAARLHGILGEAALGRGASDAHDHYAAMAAHAEATGATLLLAQALFGLAAARPIEQAAARVAEAQRLVRQAATGLSTAAEERVWGIPELARILAGNHVAFGRARRKRSTTGPVGFAPRTLGW
jgi:hypothetical protein